MVVARARCDRGWWHLVALAVVLAACSDGGSPTNPGTSGGAQESSGAAANDTSGADDSTAASSTSAVDDTGTTTGDPVDPVDPQEYLDRTLREQVAAMELLALASEGLLHGYLERIAADDDAGAGIGAVISMIEDPAALAIELDGARGDGRLLNGGIILVKDNLDMLELANTAGSLALAENVPIADAPAVARLRDAGALLLGKTNLSEWANFRGSGSSSGWSSLGGQTKNGFDPAYNPCGSSSGSAAAVAAGFASAAIGTETDGSIVCPSAVNGVVGFKPTVGLVSRTGIIPISRSQDTAGPITKDVGDAARLMTVMAGTDAVDPATDAIPPDLALDFEAGLPDATLDGARLGVVLNLIGLDPSVDAVFEAELMRMSDAGATLVNVQLPSRALFGADEYTVLLFEFKAGVNAYLASHARAGQPADLAELIDFNEANAPTVLQYFGQELFEAAQQTTDLDAPQYLDALQSARQVTRDNGIDAVLAEHRLDALVAPTTVPAWTTDLENGDPGGFGASSWAAVAGYPHLTVPMGEVGGRPVGLSIFAGAWADARVLELGYAYERL